MSPLRLVHLSDIHFNFRNGLIGFDPDEALRTELVRDLENLLGNAGGSADAIVVSGDIAYGGKREEYEHASRWLDVLCKVCECHQNAVYVCPGNHDVDQQVVSQNPLLRDAQQAVRLARDNPERNTALRERLTDASAQALFYSPLSEFNEFAGRYGCSFFADVSSYAWEDDLQMSDASVLRLRGLNSILLSGLEDQKNSLFLGENAYSIPNEAGVEYLTICHHPPSWFLDSRPFQDTLTSRARIHLFGHEHDQRIHVGQDHVTVFAGAVHPHRAEPQWKPGYNLLEVDVVSDGVQRRMDIKIHVREWQRQPPFQFRAHEGRNNAQVHEMQFLLDDWIAGGTGVETVMESTGGSSNPGEGHLVPPPDVMSRRELVNRFFRLSTSQKSEILGSLDLLDEPTDRRLPDFERFRRALLRANEQGLLGRIAELIAQSASNNV